MRRFYLVTSFALLAFGAIASPQAAVRKRQRARTAAWSSNATGRTSRKSAFGSKSAGQKASMLSRKLVRVLGRLHGMRRIGRHVGIIRTRH